MGPSGAGKSIFVNLLMGKMTQTTGSLYINGLPSQVTRFKKVIGYVPQDDVVIPECTVRDNILHSAMIRLPRSWTDAQRMEHVDSLISCLNLTDIQHRVVGDTFASNISGGQRKRVSIGIEMAAAPMALVLDEPTSGLDSTASLSIMSLLQDLSKQGVTIVCILHQPRSEILDFIDGITLLGKGHQLYHDSLRSLPNYLRSLGYDTSEWSNITDAALDIISGQAASFYGTSGSNIIDSLSRSWLAYPSKSPQSFITYEQGRCSKEQLDSIAKSASQRGLPRYRQIYLCFMRSMKQQWQRKNSFVLEISVGAIAGLLIGLSLYELRGQHFQGIYYAPFQILSSALNYTTVPQVGLLCNTAIGLAASAPGVKIFGEEKQMYWRESSAGHSRLAYFVGKTLSAFPRLIVSSIHFTAFYCILATPWMPFWKMFLTNLLYFYCIYGLASIVSMVVRREDGPLLAMIVSLIVGVFSGYGPPLNNVQEWHLEWLWRLCPGIWSSEAYFDQHLALVGHLYDLDAAAAWTGYVRGRCGVDMALLFVIGTVYRVLAFFGLIYCNKPKTGYNSGS
ncbi:ATP-binding cassette sub-family G member 2 [Stachybotrys elegans]|uniref:ATP-binding cassette sub-family G member 2 n=1 Tax=Stachybotrys elegans TaxID=80388 RepID=A0A8K0SL81_9HYPO|nr:ATP-binding cassette sub-family G member 2 [Stachybotrys elegans]